MNVIPILLLLIWLPQLTTALEDNPPDKDDQHEEGLPLTEGDLQEDEELDEVKVNQRNGLDAFEGDIMMTAEQWEELKREFKRTGQPLP
ncbi:hypothetical protein ACROYT_G042757 [Oculina patagonica]